MIGSTVGFANFKNDIVKMNLSDTTPELSVIISALNEESRTKGTITRVLRVLNEQHIPSELIFLNNHSTDKTGEIADSLKKDNPNLIVIHRYNRPNTDLGSSLKEGIKSARGDFLLIMDADLSHNPDDIPRLFSKKQEADIIIGSRFVKGGTAELHWKRRFLSRLYNELASLATGIPVKDMTTGFKIYRREKIKNITIVTNGFGLHVELPIKAYFQGATLLELPIHYERSDKKSTLRYFKQFSSYMWPVFWGLGQRIKRIF